MALTQISKAGVKADLIDGTKIADDAVGAEHIEDLDADVKFVDSAKVVLGTGNDFKIYHNGTDNYIIATSGDIRFDTGSAELARITQGGDIELPDNGEFRCGTGDDLRIFHNGTKNWIEAHNGDIGIAVNSGNEHSAAFIANGGVELYYDNSKKFETTSYGASLTGDMLISGSIDMSDNAYVLLGTGDDLTLHHDGSNSWIKNTTGTLYIQDDSAVILGSVTSAETYVKGVKDGNVELYYDNVKKLETYSTGVEVSGNLWIQDGSSTANRVTLGAGGDLNIYHDGSHSHILNNTGNLRICADGAGELILTAKSGEESIVCAQDGSVELMYDNSKKLETTSAGGTLTGVWTGAGKILQVQNIVKTTTWSSTADFVFADITDLNVTITPSSASSKILIDIDVIASGDEYATYIKLVRDSTEIGNTAASMQSDQNCFFSVIVSDETPSNSHGICHNHRRFWIDSPNTTSAVTYKLQSTARDGSHNAYINRSVPDRNNSSGEYDTRHTSSMKVMEIGP